MELTVDLHSHSGHAGGVGNVSLDNIADTMAKKGIHVFGTGDCLQPEWQEHLTRNLTEREPGLFQLNGVNGAQADARFLLQTEIIITCDVPSGGRKGTHTVLLFPSISAAAEAYSLLDRASVKLNMGRPFLKCDNADHVAAFLDTLLTIDERILVIPAHVLTPQGIYGSDHPVDSISAVFGDFSPRIVAVETGLSADPEILALIPELDERTLLSNSDCHSAALNRVGREFTTLSVDSVSYDGIYEAICNRKIVMTAEFTPAEGRYFLTGHRAGKKGHENGQYCYFSPDTVPADNICPICHKSLTVGVLQRALELSQAQGEPRELSSIVPSQPSQRLVPLVEVIAAGMSVKSVGSKKVLHAFETVISCTGTETALWTMTPEEITKCLGSALQNSVLDAILQVQQGAFTFQPLGYDGVYGELALGHRSDWFGHSTTYSDSA